MIISVKTKGYGGKTLAKTITIQSNDPVKSPMTVLVRGKVEKIAAISSENVRLEGNIDDDLNRTITVIPSEKYNFNILACKVSNGENIDVDFKKKISKEDGSDEPGWEIYIKNIRKIPGRYYEAIHLTTDFEITPKLTIRVFGNIK